MPRGFRVLLALFAILGALVLCPAYAESPQPTTLDLTLEEAVGLASKWLAEREVQKAAALTRILEQAHPEDSQVTFLAGQIALQTGDYQAAIVRFRHLLSRNPDLTRVRLDLARALFLARDYEAARYHFEFALGQPGLPEATRQNIYRYLREIAAQTSWFSFTATVGPDSNPSLATRAETLDILGNRFVLNRNAREQPAVGLVVFGQGRYAFGPENRSFVRGAFEYREFPGSYADFGYVQATVGQNLVRGNSLWTAEIGPVASRYQDRSLYDGGLVQLAHVSPLGPRVLASQFVNFRRLNYDTYGYLSGYQLWAGGVLRYAVDGTSALWGSALLGRNVAKENPYSYWATGLGLGYQKEFPARLNVEGRVAASRYNFDAPLPLFDQTRRDWLLQVDLEITARDWAWKGFAPRLLSGWSNNSSSIPVYGYRRTFVGLGVTREF